MMKILITGADGFIGSHLTDSCINKGYEVYALIRPNNVIKNLTHYLNGKAKFSEDEKLNIFDESIQIPTTNKKLFIFECDIKNNLLLEKIISDLKPNLIFHLAAQSKVIPSWKDPIDTIRTNVIGTINIFEPIKKLNLHTKVIIACSSAEYGTTTNIKRPLRENDPLLAIHPYGISKIGSELLARQYFINFGIETIILRLFIQTGPRKTGDASSDFATKIAKIELGLSEPVIEVGNLETFRDITGITDTLQGIWLATTKGKLGEIYNICSSRKIKTRDVLKMILNLTSKKIRVIENTPVKLRKTDENVILGDNTKIKNDLGFEITQSVEDLMKEMFDYWITYYKEKI